MQWQWLPFDALSTRQLYTILRLRQAVFVVEQDCPYLDADGDDVACHHLMGWRDDRLCAYLRVYPPGALAGHDELVIGRVITASHVRGQGLGRRLMHQGMHHAFQTWGQGPIYLGGQTYLQAFYQSLGFQPCGPGYLEDGIPHLPMRRPATPLPIQGKSP